MTLEKPITPEQVEIASVSDPELEAVLKAVNITLSRPWYFNDLKCGRVVYGSFLPIKSDVRTLLAELRDTYTRVGWKVDWYDQYLRFYLPTTSTPNSVDDCREGISTTNLADCAHTSEKPRPESTPASQESAASEALDQIAALSGCPSWDYPGQVVRDVLIFAGQLARAEHPLVFLEARCKSAGLPPRLSDLAGLNTPPKK